MIRFIVRTGRSKGDDLTKKSEKTEKTEKAITYTRQEAEGLVERWADMVLRVGYTWTGSIQDAQDVSQTVLLKLLTDPRRFQEERQERAWVLRVTVNCCKDLKKSAWARRRVSLDALDEAGQTEPPVLLPEESPVLRAVQALPEKYRQAVYLRYYEEYELEEIASVMGCRTTQVSTYLYRGKARLRTMLGGMYGYEQKCLSE